ncbi:MAG: hypothetical protein U0984_01785 [Prosthecobacter sp.]|nr:hypothetical protein [Prosthecobacter sp.]
MKKIHTVVLATLLTAMPCFAADDLKHLFDDPLALFQKALVPALNGGERGVVKTTLRGFQLRVDHQSQIEKSASESGIFLDVEVRDPEEIPELTDVTEKEGGLSRRTVKLPATWDGGSGLAIYLTYGTEAQPKALKALENCIIEILQKTAQSSIARPPATGSGS